jgi:hypothetical protein
MVLQNVTGWEELMSGQMVTAAFTALNVPFGGYLIFLLYIAVSMVLWIRTQSIELCTIMSLLFMGSFLVTPWFNTTTITLTIIIFVFEIAATGYKFFTKEKNL